MPLTAAQAGTPSAPAPASASTVGVEIDPVNEAMTARASNIRYEAELKAARLRALDNREKSRPKNTKQAYALPIKLWTVCSSSPS